MSIYKKIQEERVSVIKFTEEEVEELGLRPDWNYTISEDNGKIVLTPFAEVEIDFDQYTKEQLIWLIEKSVEKDISMNEVVAEILEESLKYLS